MIAFVRGRVAVKRSSFAVIDVAGVGYRLLMPTSSLASLPTEGEEATVQTYLHVREDELTLYGFAGDDERELFERLIAISGVGPKVALAVLSALTPDALRAGVASEDVPLLASVPGIGKKTAQRIIIELKDRLGPAQAAASGPTSSAAVAEAREALLTMGFSPAEAAAALREANGETTTAGLVRSALRALGGSR